MVPRKVYTPGSQPPAPPDKHAKAKAKGGLGLSPGRGRPSKKKGSTKGFSRKGNYRHKYTPEMIRQAFQLVTDKTMTLNAAAKKYGIPKTTVFDRMKFRTEKIGCPTVLTEDEETIIVERLLVLTGWVFLLNTNGLKHLIKAYLDGIGKTTRNKSVILINLIFI
jgi:transposase-like protein